MVMVIWPKAVSRDDEEWNKARALMQMIGLDPRRPVNIFERVKSREDLWPGRAFFDWAKDILHRPMVYVGRSPNPVPADYFEYCIRFEVSASVNGRIPVGDASQMEEFLLTVVAALGSDLGVAVRDRLLGYRKPGKTIDGAAPDRRFPSHYEYTMRTLHAALCRHPSHDQVLLALIEKGFERMKEGQDLIGEPARERA